MIEHQSQRPSFPVDPTKKKTASQCETASHTHFDAFFRFLYLVQGDAVNTNQQHNPHKHNPLWHVNHVLRYKDNFQNSTGTASKNRKKCLLVLLVGRLELR